MGFYKDKSDDAFFLLFTSPKTTCSNAKLKPSAIKDGQLSRYPVQLLFVMETQESKKSYAP